MSLKSLEDQNSGLRMARVPAARRRPWSVTRACSGCRGDEGRQAAAPDASRLGRHLPEGCNSIGERVGAPSRQRPGCGRRSEAGCCPAMHSSSAAPPAPRGRPPDVCSLTGSPCSITALARTPCVHAASLPHPRPSASPLPTLSPLPGSTISYSSRVLHMAGSGTFRAIPPYLFGQPLPSPSSARRQETARAARSPRTPGRHLHAIVGAPLLACRPASIVAALWICAALYR